MGKTDLLRENTKKIYKAEIEKQTQRGSWKRARNASKPGGGTQMAVELNITIRYSRIKSLKKKAIGILGVLFFDFRGVAER
jgi:hypothetical protein